MPVRRGGYERRGEEGEEQSLLPSSDSLQLGTLHYKKSEDLGPGGPGTCRQPPDQTIQCDIQPADTLLSLSLKYNVPLAELKRVNNILSDQGFYALKRIKIPVRPHSFLLPDVHDERSRNNNGWVLESKESPTFSSNLSSRVSTGYSSPYSELGEEFSEAGAELLEQTVPLVFHESKDKKKVKRLLKDMDKDLDRIREKQSELETVTSDATDLIKEPIRFPLKASQIPTDDPGCSNRTLGCWCFVVSLLILLVFIVLVHLMSIEHDTEHNNWGSPNDSRAEQGRAT